MPLQQAICNYLYYSGAGQECPGSYGWSIYMCLETRYYILKLIKIETKFLKYGCSQIGVWEQEINAGQADEIL